MKKALIIALLVLSLGVALGYVGIYAVSEIKLRDVPLPPAFTVEADTDSTVLAWGKHVARTRGCFRMPWPAA